MMTPAEAGKCVRHHSTFDTHCVKGRWYLKVLKLIYAGPSSRAVYGRSPTVIVGSNPTGGMEVCLL